MSDGVPTEEQLDRIERRVLQRIDRRADLRRLAVTASVLVALVLGGVALITPLRGTSTGSAGSSSGGGGSSAGVVVRCHVGSTSSSRVTYTEVARVEAHAVVDACARALIHAASAGDASQPAAAAPTTSAPSATGAAALVPCLDRAKRVHVYLRDAHPSTLCRRNGAFPLR